MHSRQTLFILKKFTYTIVQTELDSHTIQEVKNQNEIYIYIYIYMCVCVREREREREIIRKNYIFGGGGGEHKARAYTHAYS